MPGSKWRNVHRSAPCEICGRGTWCSRSQDGNWALCRRIDAGGEHRVDRAGVDYWLYQTGDGVDRPPEIPEEPPTERAGPDDLDRVYRAVLGELVLSGDHREALLRRGLPESKIQEGGYRTLPPRGRAALARAVLERFPGRLLAAVPGLHTREGDRGSYLSFGGPAGLLIPVRDLQRRIVALKVRRDEEGDGPKYLYVSSVGHGGPGPGAPVHVPLWSGPTRHIRITEGELKADVATSVGDVLTISVPGVSAWRAALPVLAALRPESVLLAFDADGARNPLVARATDATTQALAETGYVVVKETWDLERAKGIDDALVARVPVRAEETSPADCSRQPPQSLYVATPAGLVWNRRTSNGPVPVPLTNFLARIVTDVLEDDGAEVRRSFELDARLNGSRRRFFISAESFAAMGWATAQLGARAVVYPGQGVRDHARAAVQILSGEVHERHLYAHTGWRTLPGGWAYLHGGGAIGANGPVPGVEVALPDALAGFELPDPPAGKELVRAVRASLRILELAPDQVSVPLLAAVYRATLGQADFSVHLAGGSGAGKSELASLAQRHFGRGMDSRHLPGAWSSTANALELLAFAAKDAVLVVDDFAPTGGAADAQRAHREADRLLRGQGNRAGRLRMRSDGTLRPARPPRGLVLSTGEDVPRGQSLRARIMVCEVGPNDVDWARLTHSQAEASQGVLAGALAGFVRWLASRYEAVQEELRAWLQELRQAAAQSAAHRRTPEIVASLAAGMGYFLSFARGVGAIGEEEQDLLWQRSWVALGASARAQVRHQGDVDPVRRFLELLAAAIASGRAHLAAPDGSRPPGDEAWGWRRIHTEAWEPKGQRVGWLEDESVFLEPDAAQAVAQGLGQEIGDPLPLTPHTLRQRLKERGLLVSTDAKHQTLSIRRTFEGQRRAVLHLRKASLSGGTGPAQPTQPVLPDGAEDVAGEVRPAGGGGSGGLVGGDLPTQGGHLPAALPTLGRLGGSRNSGDEAGEAGGGPAPHRWAGTRARSDPNLPSSELQPDQEGDAPTGISSWFHPR